MPTRQAGGFEARSGGTAAAPAIPVCGHDPFRFALAVVALVAPGCDGSPMTVAVCGDGVVVTREGCDDGNAFPGDGCDSTCAPEPGWSCGLDGGCQPSCGDGIITAEDCDDGNTVAGDGCSATCEIEPTWYCLPADGHSLCRRQREVGEPCATNLECRSGACSYVDGSSDTESICIAGQNNPCRSDTCPFHVWKDEDGTLHEGGCFARRYGRGICSTGCYWSFDCPQDWHCVSHGDETMGARCRKPCRSDDDCVLEGDWCATGWCIGAEPLDAPD